MEKQITQELVNDHHRLLSALVPRAIVRLAIRWLVVGALSFFAITAWAQPVKQRCFGSDLLSIVASAEDATPERVRDDVVNAQVRIKNHIADVVINGPLMGSMDSPAIDTKIACTNRGFLLTAMITRSAEFHNATRQNQNWIPRIKLSLTLPITESVLVTVWRLRLTNGLELRDARTPPEREDLHFPILVTTQIPAVPR